MKKLIIIPLILLAIQLSGQRNYTQMQIDSIDSGNWGAEGDLYYNTDNGYLYIGLITGKLYLLLNNDTNTDDYDWMKPDDTHALDVNDDIYTNGNVGIGIRNPERPLHVNEALRLSRGGNTTSFIFDRYSGTLATTMKSFLMGVNASGIGNGEFFIADYNENTGGSNFDRMITLTDHTLPIRFNQYDGNMFKSGNEVAWLGIEADGDLVEVDPVTDTDEQDLDSSEPTDSTRDITITNGSGTVININDLDADPNNEIQNITSSDGSVTITPLTGDDFNLSVSTVDDHLGTDDQTLTEDRTVDLDGRSLTFDGTQDVIIEADGDVGIGTAAPGARLDVDNGTVRFSDYGVGNILDTAVVTGSPHPYSKFHLGVDSIGNVVEVNTVKSAKIFYPPSIVIDVSAVSGDLSAPGDEPPIDLYQQYFLRFNGPTLGPTNGPASIPTYDRSELYYYITDLDENVFSNTDLTDDGIFTYDVAMVPPGNCTWINVVFVVK